jgi:dTDP-4-amino-4,6-dideoxygalactose transaminase
MPIHLQPAYQKIYGGVGAFPITEQSSCEVLSLPLHPGSTCQEVERVADLVVRWHSRNNWLM